MGELIAYQAIRKFLQRLPRSRKSTALTVTLGEAQTFLDALPADVPMPGIYSGDDGSVELIWGEDQLGGWLKRHPDLPEDAPIPVVFVWITPQSEFSWAFDQSDHDDETKPFTFDGATVPPEIVAAIRAVVS